MKRSVRQPLLLMLVLSCLFLAVRLTTICVYNIHYRYYYYYGMVAMSFAIADGAYHGHFNAEDSRLSSEAQQLANRLERFIPLEEWPKLPASGEYQTHAPNDIPGYGYLIAYTSKWFDRQLTSKYAFALQVITELVALLLFVWCAWELLGPTVARLTGLLYIFGYPFIWPMASQPMRDVFAVARRAAHVADAHVGLNRRGRAA